MSDAVHVHINLSTEVYPGLSLTCKVCYYNRRTCVNGLTIMRFSDLTCAYLGSCSLYSTAWTLAHCGQSAAETEARSRRSYFYIGGQYVQTTLVCALPI